MDALIDDGIFLDLTDYLQYMPNYVAAMKRNEETGLQCKTDTGRYAVAWMLNVEKEWDWGGPLVRKDWLEAVSYTHLDVYKRQELKHIENFIEIQRIRYTYPILFTREGEEELKDCQIPPMMLYTFVENSVKYGLVDEAEGVHITLQIEKCREEEKQGYYFRIRDSGPGYAEDVLPVLNSGDTLLDRRGEEHYGVANVVQRLAILYHGDAEIKFENGRCV